MRVLWSVLAAFLVLGAGCLDNASEENNDPVETGDGTEPAGPGTPESFNGTGTVDRSVGTPAGSLNQGVGGEFTVGENATLIFAEIQWADTTVDLDLALDSPDGPNQAGQDTFEHNAAGGQIGSGDSPHNLTLSPGDASDWGGVWRLTAFANGAAVDVSYQWAVTVFYGETEVPAGHTGLGNATA